MISLPTRKAWPALLALVAFILIGAGCKNFFTDPQLTSIAISPAGPTVAIGATTTLSARGTYDDNSTKDVTSSVTWLSNNTAVATVTNKGVVTGVSNGSTSIQATASNGITASVTIAVGSAVVLQTISVLPATATIASGLTQQYAATGHYSDGTTADITSSVTWTSGTAAVATIDSAGLATVVGTSGQTTNITATSGSIVSPAVVLTVQ
jgi:Bacterial Ig-like domain (group 2)